MIDPLLYFILFFFFSLLRLASHTLLSIHHLLALHLRGASSGTPLDTFDL